jgi:hypothetical protein
MVMSMFVSAFAASTSFEDVKDPNCAGAVEALVELGVVNGMPDGTFAPENKVTRAQLAKMLVLCTGLVEGMSEAEAEEYFADYADNKVFNDVEGHWGAGYVNAAAQLKLISGYPDGSFKPNKDVSYAEAITMMIRALGYGNVVDAEGTWPVAYTAKARELGLYENVKGAVAGDAAIRGNVAILLWNMLTTPMWKIQQESEGNGMTSFAAGELMLNVKFPDYKYVENATIETITVADQDVRIHLDDGTKDGVTAFADGQYLPHLLLNMEVTALVKDWKDADEATFLTLTPANTVVEGLVTKTTETRITIEDTAYRFDNANNYADAYVVAEIEGSKVLNIAVLPETFTEVEDLRTMENAIDEDALVIIDGEWATRDDIEEGNVYTEFNDDNSEVVGTYYVVATERVEGEFESLTVENKDTERTFLEVDGEEYRVNADFEAYEEEENDEEVTPEQLKAPAKDNEFLGADVELVLNYLGQVVRMNFGYVADINAGGDFYAVTSNGIWTASTSEGEVEYIKLVGLDGEEETYTLTRSASASLEEELANKAVFDNAEKTGKATFVYAKFNDEGEVKSIKVLAEGDYEDYAVVAFTAYEDRYFDKNTAHRVLDSTVVFKVAPEVHEEDDVEYVTGFDVEVLEGPEALNGVEGDFYAYDSTSIAQRVKFVFVSDDAKSDFNYGLVEETDHRAGKFFITINGEEYEFDAEAYEDVLAEMLEDESVKFDYDRHLKVLYGKLVAFTELDGKVTVEKYLEPSDLDNGENGAAIVLGKDKEDSKVVVLDKQVPGSSVYTSEDLNGYAIDLSTEDNDEVVNAYSKYTFLKAKATVAKEGNKVEFSSEVEDLGRGIEGITLNKADRLVIDEANKLVVIVTIATVKVDTVITDGAVVVPSAI